MGSTLSQRIVDSMPWLDGVAEKVQPKVQEIVHKGDPTLRNILDGVWFGSPLHPVLQTLPIGSWSAVMALDAVDIVTGSKTARNGADSALAVGVAGGYVTAAVGFSDWRYLSGGSRRMGMAHALLNSVGLVLNTASLVLRATGRRNLGRAAFLAGYSLNGMGAHLGGELSYHYGLRVNRDVFEPAGPDEFVPVLGEDELPGPGEDGGMRKVSVEGTEVLLARASDGEICAISNICGHFAGPLAEGEREGDTVICPWHSSRFDLKTGHPIDGPAVFPQSTYETRVREGKIELRASDDNAQKKVR